MQKTRVAKLFLALIGCIVVIGCASHKDYREKHAACAPVANFQLPVMNLSLSRSENIRGVFLVSHGLNNRPEVMEDLVSLLNAQGFHTLLVSFSGHETGGAWSKDTSMDTWIENLRSGYCRAKNEFPNLKIHGLGYSLGATVFLAMSNRYRDITINSYIFFAPAIKLRSKATLLKWLTILSFTGLSLPSFAPPEYRAHAHTPLGAYKALFNILELATQTEKTKNGIQTLIFLRKEDELIDIDASKYWAENTFMLSRIYEIPPQILSDLPQHLMIDKRSLGDEVWRNTAKIIDEFMRNQTTSYLPL